MTLCTGPKNAAQPFQRASHSGASVSFWSPWGPFAAWRRGPLVEGPLTALSPLADSPLTMVPKALPRRSSPAGQESRAWRQGLSPGSRGSDDRPTIAHLFRGTSCARRCQTLLSICHHRGATDMTRVLSEIASRSTRGEEAIGHGRAEWASCHEACGSSGPVEPTAGLAEVRPRPRRPARPRRHEMDQSACRPPGGGLEDPSHCVRPTSSATRSRTPRSSSSTSTRACRHPGAAPLPHATHGDPKEGMGSTRTYCSCCRLRSTARERP